MAQKHFLVVSRLVMALVPTSLTPIIRADDGTIWRLQLAAEKQVVVSDDALIKLYISFRRYRGPGPDKYT